MSVTMAASFALTAAGVFVLMLGALRTGHLRAGLPMMLEMWTAGGMLKLSGSPTWSSIIVVAILIALRRAVNRSLASVR